MSFKAHVVGAEVMAMNFWGKELIGAKITDSLSQNSYGSQCYTTNTIISIFFAETKPMRHIACTPF
jgi:hypothetical protein